VPLTNVGFFAYAIPSKEVASIATAIKTTAIPKIFLFTFSPPSDVILLRKNDEI
jgi:hypothetical protein